MLACSVGQVGALKDCKYQWTGAGEAHRGMLGVGKSTLLEGMCLDEQFRGGDWTVTVAGWCTVWL
jgi:hypothetical protein